MQRGERIEVVSQDVPGLIGMDIPYLTVEINRPVKTRLVKTTKKLRDAGVLSRRSASCPKAIH